jgi:hypothetical protein
MILESTFQSGNLTANIYRVGDGIFSVEFLVDQRFVNRASFATQQIAEDAAENFILSGGNNAKLLTE